MLCAPVTTWLLVTIYPRWSIITPEPIALFPRVVTFTSTTAGFTFAITASCTVSILFPVSAGIVGVVPVCNAPVGFAVLAPPAAVLVLPNCQPANRPIPKIIASRSVSATIAPVRMPPDLRIGVAGGGLARGGLVGGRGGCCREGDDASGLFISHGCCSDGYSVSDSLFI